MSVDINLRGEFGGGVNSDDCTTSAERIAAVNALCAEAIALLPPPVESLALSAMWRQTAHARIVILVAGLEGERLHGLLDDGWSSRTDHAQAQLFASTLCTSRASSDRYIGHAIIEARSILQRQWHCVRALAAALDERKALCGDDVDEIIAEATAAEQHRVELARRASQRATADRVASSQFRVETR
ncbi:hypothetical protein [Methylocella sp.]|uniref:hypothetical protein n=1 Tax=Methylocella sp. TaxID=1978226 RepID=UPI003C226CDE